MNVFNQFWILRIVNTCSLVVHFYGTMFSEDLVIMCQVLGDELFAHGRF